MLRYCRTYMLTHAPREIATRVHKLACLLGRTAEQALAKEIGLTFSQFRMLVALYKGHDLTQKRIAAFHGLTEAAVSRQIDTLRKHRYVQAVPHTTNRRERHLELTPKGRAFMSRAVKTLESTLAVPFAALSSDHTRKLNAYLDKLITSLERSTPS